jgi:hypothetical protein
MDAPDEMLPTNCLSTDWGLGDVFTRNVHTYIPLSRYSTSPQDCGVRNPLGVHRAQTGTADTTQVIHQSRSIEVYIKGKYDEREARISSVDRSVVATITVPRRLW